MSLKGKERSANFKHDEVYHVDEVLRVMDDEQKARTWDDRPPDLGGMSLVALKSHLLALRVSQQCRW